MKKAITISLMLFFGMIGIAQAAQQSVTFGWNCNTEANLAGYHLKEAINYDFTHYDTVKDIPIGSYTSNNGKCEYTYVFDAPDGKDTMYNWRLTAYNSDGLESAPSNQTHKNFDLTAPEPTIPVPPVLSAPTFIASEQVVEIPFSQNSLELIDHWDAFLVVNGAFQKIETLVKSDMKTPYSFRYKVSQNGTYSFVLVGFMADGTYTENSNQITATVLSYPGAPQELIIIDKQ